MPVRTDDEFGFIAGHTNAMILGLRDRHRMQQGLLVAREVFERVHYPWFFEDFDPAATRHDAMSVVSEDLTFFRLAAEAGRHFDPQVVASLLDEYPGEADERSP